ITILGHQLDDNIGELDWHLAIERSHVSRKLLLVLKQLLKDSSSRERGPTREHLKHRAAQGIQVATDVNIAGVARLLRADVVKSSQRHPALSETVVATSLEPARQTHVDQFGLPAGGNDDVRRLDVPVYDTAF